MSYRQYTSCYQHTPGDVPFKKDDLLTFVAGAAGLPATAAMVAFALGAWVIGAVVFAVGFAIAVTAVANEWLNHRLVCLTPGEVCAVGVVVDENGEERGAPALGSLGEFDNDQFFDLRLMPHRQADEYTKASAGWPEKPLVKVNRTHDDATKLWPPNDIYSDGLQGSELVAPRILGTAPKIDLPFDTTRCRLHCEAEGNFWPAMKEYAGLAGAVVGTSAGFGAAAGCAAGSWFFGPIGCLIGAIIGALLAGGAAAGVAAVIAFNADPGNVEDANVGDKTLGPIGPGDHVVVYGRHVYDGFHEGWHEMHPLMAVMKIHLDESRSGYLEWLPSMVPGARVPGDSDQMPFDVSGLTVDDMRRGLDSKRFATRAKWLRDTWCQHLREAFDPHTRTLQQKEEHRWTIHPSIDGCLPDDLPPQLDPPVHLA